MRDHGGNLDAAIARFGTGDWLDLSTGINPFSYPVPEISPDAWRILPTQSQMDDLEKAAIRYFQTSAEPVAFCGAQGAIQMIPFLVPRGCARVLGPTYNEHLAALKSAGWAACQVTQLNDLRGSDLAVVVNPNNPDGRTNTPADLVELAQHVGVLVVDESFVDTCPQLSMCRMKIPENVVILRSFGKFFGLAGLRLGWAVARRDLALKLRDIAGPWPVSGPSIAIACAALADGDWQVETRSKLEKAACRLDRLAQVAGWRLVGGTDLFRTYVSSDAVRVQNHLARHHIWSRIFPYSKTWIRLGMPDIGGFGQLEHAFHALTAQPE